MVIIVTAGGGLLQNDFGEYLLIYRNGRWDLPKGVRNEGEALADTALREVREECGIENITIGRLIVCTWHSYWVDRDVVFKQTHWYHMHVQGKPIPSPQTEEGIEQCCWCSLEEAWARINQSYPSIRWLFRRATQGPAPASPAPLS